MTANDFKKFVADAAKQKQQVAQVQAGAAVAGAAKDGASAQQSLAQAGAIRNGQATQAGIPAA